MADPCLLTYGFSTSPAPLAVTTGATPALGVINAGVSAGGTPVYCSQIIVAVPLGADATDLSVDTPSASLNTARWTLSSVKVVPGESWGRPGGTYGQFTFMSRDPSDQLIDFSLVFGLSAQVNTAPGTFDYLVQETSGTDPSSLEVRTGSFPLAKEPPVFYLDNLVATTVDAPTLPCSLFGNGQPIRFAWESDGTWFQLFGGDDPTPVYEGPETTCTVSAGVAAATTFVLAGSVTGNPDGDTPSGGYETLYLYAVATVQVSDPDLTPRSVVVADDVAVGGSISGAGLAVTGPVSADTVTATAGVTAAGLGVSGPASVGSLGVTGPASLAEATVAGPLTVAGASSLAAASVSQLLAGTGAAVSLMGTPSGLEPNSSYQATTDGFVVGQILGTAAGSMGWIYCGSGGIWAGASGGSVVYGSHGSTAYVNGSLVMPVRNGASFSVQFNQYAGWPVVTFMWMPLGTGEPTLLTGDAADPEAVVGAPLPAVPEPAEFEGAPLSEQVRGAEGDDRDRLRTALVELLAEG